MLGYVAFVVALGFALVLVAGVQWPVCVCVGVMDGVVGLWQ